MWLITLVIVAVPLALIGFLALSRQPGRFQFALITLAFSAVLFFLWLSFPWHVVSVWLRALYTVLFFAAVVIGYRRIRPPVQPGSRWQPMISAGINLVLIVFMGGLCWKSLEGYIRPGGTIDLVSPLRDGRFVVGNGGASPFINGHFKVRPQTFALDIIGLNGLGRNMAAFGDRADLHGYAIFGTPVYSPCNGAVLSAVDGFDDLVPPAYDRANLAGNHVVIECFGLEVVLAHLQKGSVAVQAGETVSVENLLGKVGNSGNTSEPHLHIHAEKDGEEGVILDGKAAPFSIDGRWLVRGSIL